MRIVLALMCVGVVCGCGGPTVLPGSPAAPSGLEVSELGGGAHVTWKDNSEDEDDFEIWRKEGSGDFVKIFTVIFDIVQYHDASVRPGAQYTYRVRAENANGVSAFTSDVTFTLSSSGAGGGSGTAGGTGGTAGGTAGGMSGTGGGSAGGSGGSAGGATEVSFSRDIKAILGRSCGSGDMNCHAPITYFANVDQACRGWLSLADMPLGAMYCGPNGCRSTGCPDRTLYQRLLQLEPWMCTGGKKYVVPGNPDASLFYVNVLGVDPSMGGLCRDGSNLPLKRMPKDPATMMSAAPLPAAEIELIRQWILAGAPNN